MYSFTYALLFIVVRFKPYKGSERLSCPSRLPRGTQYDWTVSSLSDRGLPISLSGRWSPKHLNMMENSTFLIIFMAVEFTLNTTQFTQKQIHI